MFSGGQVPAPTTGSGTNCTVREDGTPICVSDTAIEGCTESGDTRVCGHLEVGEPATDETPPPDQTGSIPVYENSCTVNVDNGEMTCTGPTVTHAPVLVASCTSEGGEITSCGDSYSEAPADATPPPPAPVRVATIFGDNPALRLKAFLDR